MSEDDEGLEALLARPLGFAAWAFVMLAAFCLAAVAMAARRTLARLRRPAASGRPE